MTDEIIDLVVDPRTGTHHDPRDTVGSGHRSSERRAFDSWNKEIAWLQSKFIFAAIGLVTSFWLFHYVDVRWMNAVAFLVLTMYIWVAGTSLKWLVSVFIFGALIRPGSETARRLAGTEAVKVWVTKWVMLVLHAVQLSALFFLVWPFEVNFGQFVMGAIALIFVGVSIVRFNITLGKWLENISFWGGIVLFVAVLGSTAFGFNPFATREEIRDNLPSFNNNVPNNNIVRQLPAVAPPHPLCLNPGAGNLPGCRPMTFGATEVAIFSPGGHCPAYNPGGLLERRADPNPDRAGWWYVKSKSGKEVEVGVYFPAIGQTFLGSTCH